MLCAMIHSGQAMELVKNKVKNIRLEIFQHEYDGESHNVIAEIPGKERNTSCLVHIMIPPHCLTALMIT